MSCFLALVMLCTGLQAMAEPRDAGPLTAATATLQVAIDGPNAAMDDTAPQPLDDLPAPVLLEPAAETPGLLPAPWRAWLPRALAWPPRCALQAGADSPDLAGPLRPPCSAALRG